jgi:hypothetical protein
MSSAQALYVPKKKIAIASSFEGVVNNGATECAFVAMNAMQRMIGNKQLPGFYGYFFNQYTIDEFKSNKVKNSEVVQAFLKLRPLVAVASDYLTVLQVIEIKSEKAFNIIKKDRPIDQINSDIEYLTRYFSSTKSAFSGEREIFDKVFYEVRKETQKDYGAWLSLQEPFPHTIEQMRILNSLKSAQGKDFAGFVMYYVTSKDEASTYQLCNVYGELNLFKNGEISDVKFNPEVEYAKWFESLKTCLISEDRIIGKNKVEKADKVKQMVMVAEKENIPRNQVLRVQDRFDEKEIAELKQAGFEHHLIVKGGYAFPSDYEKAQKAGIPVFEREKMAEFISEFAREKGF